MGGGKGVFNTHFHCHHRPLAAYHLHRKTPRSLPCFIHQFVDAVFAEMHELGGHMPSTIMDQPKPRR